MEKNYQVCRYCSEKHCCKGLCREMNDYLISKKNKEILNNEKRRDKYV